MSRIVGVQLYSLRQELEQNFIGTIEELAEIGYPLVEGWASMPLAHQSIAKVLKAHNLTMKSCHLPMPLGEDEAAVMQAVEAYDLRYAIVPWLDPSNFTTEDKVLRVCEQLNKANEKFKSSDVRFGYHNHDFEFTTINGRTAYDIMIEELDPSIVLQIDTYWVQLAGYDPVELIQRLGNRSPLLHIKDGEADKAKREKPMVALGEGNVDIDGILSASEDSAELLIVEIDRCGTDMMTAIKNSYQYLAENGIIAEKKLG